MEILYELNRTPESKARMVESCNIMERTCILLTDYCRQVNVRKTEQGTALWTHLQLQGPASWP